MPIDESEGDVRRYYCIGGEGMPACRYPTSLEGRACVDAEEHAAALHARDREIDWLREASVQTNEEICQILGKALGYPWFKDESGKLSWF